MTLIDRKQNQPKERWLRWRPIADLPRELYLEELIDNRDGLTLRLSEGNNSRILQIRFDGYYAYRNMNEGDCLVGDRYVESEKDTNLVKVPLYTVQNSHYMEWFHCKSCGVRKNDRIIHYVVTTPEDMVEILDLDSPEEPPSVNWITR